MTNFLYQLEIDFKRIILRNPAFFMFDLAMPFTFYLLFTKALPHYSNTMQWKVDYLVSMAIYGILLGSIMTVAHTLSSDIDRKFTLFIDLSPFPKFMYYIEMIIIFEVLNLLCLVGIGLAGILVNNLTLPTKVWILLLILIPIMSLPLVLLGILISSFKDSNVINALANILVFPMAICSGLWWPLSVLPQWLQKIGKVTPTYYISNLSNNILHGNSINYNSLVGLIIWFVVLVLALGISYIFTSKKDWKN